MSGAAKDNADMEQVSGSRKPGVRPKAMGQACHRRNLLTLSDIHAPVACAGHSPFALSAMRRILGRPNLNVPFIHVIALV
jgi:hypothetical protein